MSSIFPLSSQLRSEMIGASWHEDLPCPALEELRELHIPFRDFSGAEQLGLLITSVQFSEALVAIFAKLYDLGFPIARMTPVCKFAGDDGLSMAANNSSCFNARRIIGTERLSLHSYGAAVDVNPVQNPVLRRDPITGETRIRPDEGRDFLDRQDRHPGLFREGEAPLAAFLEAGWQWGGHWEEPKDYHHFYLPIPEDR